MFDPATDEAMLRMQLAMLRVQLTILRTKANFNPRQPRVPAGEPEGGRWTDTQSSPSRRTTPSIHSSRHSVPATSRTVLDASGRYPWSQVITRHDADGAVIFRDFAMREGSRIEESYRAGGGTLDRVTLPNGERAIFETDGERQRIFDRTGHLASETLWGLNGPVPQAIVQPAFSDAQTLPSDSDLVQPSQDRLLPSVRPFDPPSISEPYPVFPAFGFGATMFGRWAAQDGVGSKAVLVFRAERFDRQSMPGPILWAGPQARQNVEALCKRLGLIEGMADRAAARLRPNMFTSPATRGTAIHLAVKEEITSLGDPLLRAEQSVIKSKESPVRRKLPMQPGGRSGSTFSSRAVMTSSASTISRPDHRGSPRHGSGR
jgi:hypothetical protein